MSERAIEEFRVVEEPYYLPINGEVDLFAGGPFRSPARHTQRPNRLRQNPLRRTHGVAAWSVR